MSSNTPINQPKRLILNEELRDRIAERQKFKKYSLAVQIAYFVFFLYPLIAIAYLAPLNAIVSPWVLLVWLGGLAIAALISNLIDRKKRSYPVADDEWVLFYTDDISKNIDKLLTSGHQAMKGRYRKKALISAKKFLKNMVQNWDTGDFKLVEDLIGTTVDDFKSNFKYVVLPTIETGDEEKLRNLASLLKALKVDSENLQLSHLGQFNVTISNSVAKGIANRSSQTSKTTLNFQPQILKNPAIIIAFMVVSSALAGSLFYWLGLSKEFSVGSSITIFALLFGKYKFRSK